MKHLAQREWDSTVLTVEPGDESTDEELLSEVPDSCRVVRTPWVHVFQEAGRWARPWRRGRGGADAPRNRRRAGPPCAGRRRWLAGAASTVQGLLTTPDSRIGWWPSAVRAGVQAIRDERPDILYSTSPYATAHLIALRLHGLSGIPWVADFRDPWCGNPFDRKQAAVVRCWDAVLERMVLRNADHVVCNTPTATAALCRRRPFVAGKCTTIMNGVDAEAFSGIEPVRLAPDDCFVLLHCGQFYGRRRPHSWFAALQTIRRTDPRLADRIRFISLGATTCDSVPLMGIAAHYGLGPMFEAVEPGSHRDALAAMAGSDALVLAGAEGPGAELQVPNKLYEYLALRRPILLACDPRNPALQVLREAHANHLAAAPTDASALAAAIRRMATRPPPADPTLWSGVQQFERSHRAAELDSIFTRLCAKGPLARPQAFATVVKSATVEVGELPAGPAAARIEARDRPRRVRGSPNWT